MIMTRPVVKTWLDGQLQPCSGSVIFTLEGPLEEEPGLRVVVPSPVAVPVGAGGVMRWEECPTTDIGTGAVYKVTPRLLDSAGVELWCSPNLMPPFHVLIPGGTTEMELPPATYPTSGYVPVVGPSGPGVLFLEDPNDPIPPGAVPPMLVVTPKA